jgi:hypothetical protein
MSTLLALAVTVAIFGGSNHLAVLAHEKADALRAAVRRERALVLAREETDAREAVRRHFEAAALAGHPGLVEAATPGVAFVSTWPVVRTDGGASTPSR